MNSPIAVVSGFRPAATKLILMPLVAVALFGCQAREETGAHVAGWSLVDASQRHPILVSQQPATLSIRVAMGAHGLSDGQAAQVSDFLARYRSKDSGNSKLVIAVPSGSPNESAAMRAVGNMREMIRDFGFSESTVAMQPYSGGRDPSAPIRLAYLRYVAEAPELRLRAAAQSCGSDCQSGRPARTTHDGAGGCRAACRRDRQIPSGQDDGFRQGRRRARAGQGITRGPT
jgi:pilus biogenesis lipoprotein CpaD